MKHFTRLIITIFIIPLFIIALPILPFILVSPYHNVLGYSGTGSWDQYQGDCYHDGFSSYPGPVTPGILWSAIAAGDLGIVAAEGLVITSGAHFAAYAFSFNNGALVHKYSVSTGLGKSLASFPTIAGTTLIMPGIYYSDLGFGPPINELQFVNIYQNGTLSTHILNAFDVASTCELMISNLIYLSQQNNKEIYYFSISSETLAGDICLNSPVAANPVFGDGLVFVPLYNGSVVAFNYGYNTSTWELNLGSPASSSPSYGGGSFYVVTSNNLLYSISPKGSINWFYNLGSQGLTPAVGLGKVFVGTISGELYAFTTQGNVVWEVNTSSPITTPPVIASNGVVYVGTSDGEIYAFNTSDGREIWSWTLPNQVSSLALYDGNLYAITSAGQLYAFANEQKVIFIETGLPSGTLWSVSVNNKTEISTNNTIVFDLPNGIFNYTVHKINGYSSNVSFGILEVEGQNLRVEIGFSPGWSPASPPLDVRAAGQANSILISWSPPQYDGAPAGFVGNAISYYYIYRGTSPGNLTFYARVPGNTTYMVDYAVSDGTVYYYAVAAVNEAGVGSLSQVVSATPLLISVPSPPRNLTINVGYNFIVLKWDPPATTGGSPITYYIIYGGTSKNQLQELAALPPNETYYVDYQVQPGTAYYFQVVAANSEGDSSPSNLVAGTTTTNGEPGPIARFHYNYLDPNNPNVVQNLVGLITMIATVAILPPTFLWIKSDIGMKKAFMLAIAIIAVCLVVVLFIPYVL
ncbi:hypothetical protein EWF20_06285 [Sulfolobus sp. S-194]|uniref:outer membrane protein assembly factor BamB family protein n=1 Tax=Sulfolobus sp. S-194 TaxID=2512240 RepID=UPI001436D1C7|nr:PQQ-binding-like beta-propeller repeat protein [Sulfolobus sp. S-194]QIW23801.1 hypothetical protein EWF20_06285 [Sulfolobus sp. S-194]